MWNNYQLTLWTSSRHNPTTNNPTFTMVKPDSDRGPGERVKLMTLDNQPPKNTPTTSPAMDTNAGSTRVSDAYAPSTPPTASTLEELLALEGYTPADIMTCRIKGRLVKVVEDPKLRCWKVTEDKVDGGSVFGLVLLEGRVRDKVNGIMRKKAAREREARAADGKGKVVSQAGAEYIVDRPGDPWYRDWVMKVLKPRVRGSALVDSEPPPEREDNTPFGWMSKEWKKGYNEDTDLGQLAKNQAAVSVLVFSAFSRFSSLASCFFPLGSRSPFPFPSTGHRAPELTF